MAYSIYSTSTLSASTTVSNFQTIREGHLYPRDGAALVETTTAIHIGSSTYVWDKLYVDQIGPGVSLTVSAPVHFTATPTFATSTSLVNLGPPRTLLAQWVSLSGITGTGYEPEFPFNTLTINQIAGASLTSGQVSLPSGIYVVFTDTTLQLSQGFTGQVILYDLDSGLDLAQGSSNVQGALSYIRGQRFSLVSQTAMELRFRVAATDPLLGTFTTEAVPMASLLIYQVE